MICDPERTRREAHRTGTVTSFQGGYDPRTLPPLVVGLIFGTRPSERGSREERRRDAAYSLIASSAIRPSGGRQGNAGRVGDRDPKYTAAPPGRIRPEGSPTIAQSHNLTGAQGRGRLPSRIAWTVHTESLLRDFPSMRPIDRQRATGRNRTDGLIITNDLLYR